uniref:DUF4939 domain-containing protein n=1 Tax=Physcomitrium patens TaxID=3218 RepID=A0A2K1KEH3_PHYPA|nr:hypothetical protein PHYPA_008546 [Physcomitrium patens]
MDAIWVSAQDNGECNGSDNLLNIWLRFLVKGCQRLESLSLLWCCAVSSHDLVIVANACRDLKVLDLQSHSCPSLRMVGGQDISMTESSESKLDAIMNVLATLSQRTAEIEGVVARLHNDGASGMGQSRLHQPQTSTLGEATLPQVRQAPLVLQHKEPRVSLPDKFDGTRSKFRGFINQIKLIIVLQPKRYPTEESRVGLVGTLLTGQALSWFAPLFEKRSSILNNFETFLEAFAEAFGEYDKVRWTTTKIWSLLQGMRSTSVYASDFR